MKPSMSVPAGSAVLNSAPRHSQTATASWSATPPRCPARRRASGRARTSTPGHLGAGAVLTAIGELRVHALEAVDDARHLIAGLHEQPAVEPGGVARTRLGERGDRARRGLGVAVGHDAAAARPDALGQPDLVADHRRARLLPRLDDDAREGLVA